MRDEQHRAARLHQSVSYGTHRVGLAGSGHPERRHVDAAVDEVTLTEYLEMLSELDRCPVVLEGVPGLAYRQLRRPPQTVHPSDTSVLCLLLHHLHKGHERVGMTGLAEPPDGLCRKRGQLELPAQIPYTVRNGARCVSVNHHRAPPTSRRSYTPRSTVPDSFSSGTGGGAGADSLRTIA